MYVCGAPKIVSLIDKPKDFVGVQEEELILRNTNNPNKHNKHHCFALVLILTQGYIY